MRNHLLLVLKFHKSTDTGYLQKSKAHARKKFRKQSHKFDLNNIMLIEIVAFLTVLPLFARTGNPMSVKT